MSVSVGFAGVSLKMSLVFGRMAAFTTSASLKSTKLNVTPRSENITRAARFVPPYEHSVITQWSPFFFLSRSSLPSAVVVFAPCKRKFKNVCD